MNIKALITTLAIVGSSSVAMARPVTTSATASVNASWSFGTPNVTVRDHRTTTVRPVRHVDRDRDYVRDDDRYYVDRDYYPYRQDTGWARAPRFDMLGSQLNFGEGEYRKDIMPGALASRFSTLKLTADRGRTYVMKVVVEFADGTSQQQIDLNRTLRAGEEITIDLTGNTRAINRILVYRADGNNVAHLYQRHIGEFSISAK